MMLTALSSGFLWFSSSIPPERGRFVLFWRFYTVNYSTWVTLVVSGSSWRIRWVTRFFVVLLGEFWVMLLGDGSKMRLGGYQTPGARFGFLWMAAPAGPKQPGAGTHQKSTPSVMGETLGVEQVRFCFRLRRAKIRFHQH